MEWRVNPGQAGFPGKTYLRCLDAGVSFKIKFKYLPATVLIGPLNLFLTHALDHRLENREIIFVEPKHE
jgi:hypothetical protein